MIRDHYAEVYDERFELVDDDVTDMKIFMCELLNQFERLNENLDKIVEELKELDLG